MSDHPNEFPILMDVVDEQFEIAARHMTHADRVKAFAQKEHVKSVIGKIFEVCADGSIVQYCAETSKWEAGILTMLAPEIMECTTKAEFIKLMQDAMFESFDIEVTDQEREAFAMYTQYVSLLARKVIVDHIHTLT